MKKKHLIAKKRMNEFRYHNTIVKTNGKKKKKRHPAYIWQQRGNTYDFHTITHSSLVEGIKLRKLSANPNPKDNRNSYININSQNDLKANFGKRIKGWKLSDEDRIKIHKK